MNCILNSLLLDRYHIKFPVMMVVATLFDLDLGGACLLVCTAWGRHVFAMVVRIRCTCKCTDTVPSVRATGDLHRI